MSLNRKFLGAVPVLMVEDVDRSIDYYIHRLQFRLAGRIKDDLAWLQLAGDDEKDTQHAAVNIFLQRDPAKYEEGVKKQGGRVLIRLGLGIQRLQVEIQLFGGKPSYSVDGILGLKEFTVTDLDSNTLVFSVDPITQSNMTLMSALGMLK